MVVAMIAAMMVPVAMASPAEANVITCSGIKSPEKTLDMTVGDADFRLRFELRYKSCTQTVGQDYAVVYNYKVSATLQSGGVYCCYTNWRWNPNAIGTWNPDAKDAPIHGPTPAYVERNWTPDVGVVVYRSDTDSESCIATTINAVRPLGVDIVKTSPSICVNFNV